MAVPKARRHVRNAIIQLVIKILKENVSSVFSLNRYRFNNIFVWIPANGFWCLNLVESWHVHSYFIHDVITEMHLKALPCNILRSVISQWTANNNLDCLFLAWKGSNYRTSERQQRKLPNIVSHSASLLFFWNSEFVVVVVSLLSSSTLEQNYFFYFSAIFMGYSLSYSTNACERNT